MDTLDRTLLEHLGRYRLSVRAVLDQLRDAGEALDAALVRLLRSGLISARRSLPGNRALYQLSKKGADVIAISEARARSFRAQAIYKHLGLLLFCHVGGSQRFRLEDDELRELLGDMLPEGAYCMALIDGTPVLMCVYVPGPRTSLRSIVRRVREQLDGARQLPVLREMIGARCFGIAVVVDSAQRRKVISAALHRPERDGRPSLARQTRIIIESIPAFDLLINGVPLDESPKGANRRSSKSTRRRDAGTRNPNLFESDEPQLERES